MMQVDAHYHQLPVSPWWYHDGHICQAVQGGRHPSFLPWPPAGTSPGSNHPQRMNANSVFDLTMCTCMWSASTSHCSVPRSAIVGLIVQHIVPTQGIAICCDTVA